MNNFIKASLGLLVIFLFNSSYAMISVSPVIIDLAPKESSQIQSQDVRVFNHGSQIAYVRVTPKLVTNPGTTKEKQVEITNPQELGLLISPRKLMIPPGQFKMIRFVFTKKSGNDDRIFRVDIQPVSGSLLLPKTVKEEVGIKLIVGYAVLVIQRAKDPMPKVTIQRSGREVTIHNSGNTNVILVDGKQCDAVTNKCVELETQRLYAGNTWKFKAPKSEPVTFKGYYGDSNLTVKSD